MSDDIYHEALLTLAKDKSKSGRLDPCDGSARADNPLCGDRVTVDLRLAEGRIAEIAQKTRGCILTQAAAAMIARHSASLGLDELQEKREAMARYLAGNDDVALWPEGAWFEPVREVKSRHDCVMIAFQALESAMKEATK